jgi:phage-related minor tail protein
MSDGKIPGDWKEIIDKYERLAAPVLDNPFHGERAFYHDLRKLDFLVTCIERAERARAVTMPRTRVLLAAILVAHVLSLYSIILIERSILVATLVAAFLSGIFTVASLVMIGRLHVLDLDQKTIDEFGKTAGAIATMIGMDSFTSTFKKRVEHALDYASKA